MTESPPSQVTPRAVRKERLLTWPLGVFLGTVALLVGLGLRSKFPRPDVDGAILLLADGDLDGVERVRMLRRMLDGALHSQVTGQRWAGLMTAVALEDRTSYAALLAALQVGAGLALPTAGERLDLHLGDPLLGNLVLAMIGEAEGERVAALRLWRQVAAESRLTGRAFPAELAAAALQRLS